MSGGEAPGENRVEFGEPVLEGAGDGLELELGLVAELKFVLAVSVAI
jgi:hypothetical protein